MMYPFMTLNDKTEIVHSEAYIENNKEIVKVYIEKPDEKDGFHHMTCYLPNYSIEDVYGFSKEDVDKYMEIIRSTSHLILEFAKDGGFENAANF